MTGTTRNANIKIKRRVSSLTVMNAADKLLCALRWGAATFDPNTREFCFRGLRYSTFDYRDATCWVRLVEVIGEKNLIDAIADAQNGRR